MQFNRSEQTTQSIGGELNESLFCHALALLIGVSFLVVKSGNYYLCCLCFLLFN